MSDEQLMVRVKRGDRPAFEALYSRWKDPLIRYLIRRTGSRQHAEDALQETFIRVFRFRARFDPALRFRPWVYRIATNAGHDAPRPLPQGFTLSGDVAADHIGMRDTLVSALHGLDPLSRRILLLAVEGFTPTETAALLEMKAGTVRMRLHRVRTQMKERLEGWDG